MNATLRLEYAEQILCECLNCGSRDLECIYEMEKNHTGTIERAVELKEELGNLNFGNFVMAVKEVSLTEITDNITEADKESFQDMVIDDNYMAWGTIASYGSYEGKDTEDNHRRQELFCDFVNGSITKSQFLKQLNQKLSE